jgi:hypothetical protein
LSGVASGYFSYMKTRRRLFPQSLLPHK